VRVSVDPPLHYSCGLLEPIDLLEPVGHPVPTGAVLVHQTPTLRSIGYGCEARRLQDVSTAAKRVVRLLAAETEPATRSPTHRQMRAERVTQWSRVLFLSERRQRLDACGAARGAAQDASAPMTDTK